MSITIILALSAALAAPSHLPQVPKTFETAKRHLYGKVYHDKRETLYCGCVYDADRVVDLVSCGMETLTGSRARRVEAEHIVPASEFGRTRGCWAEGGRSNCMKVDEGFRAFHNDLNNLAPAVGHVNARRSDNDHGIIEGEKREFGECDFEVDHEDDLAEAQPSVRGFIGRTYLYAYVIHGLPLPDARRIMYLQWHLEHPPTDWERTRDDRNFEQQHSRNMFVR